MRAAEPRGCECAAWGSHRSSTSLVPLGVLTQQSPLPHSSGCGGKCHHEDVAPTSPSSLLAQPGQPWAGGVGPRRAPHQEAAGLSGEGPLTARGRPGTGDLRDWSSVLQTRTKALPCLCPGAGRLCGSHFQEEHLAIFTQIKMHTPCDLARPLPVGLFHLSERHMDITVRTAEVGNRSCPPSEDSQWTTMSTPAGGAAADRGAALGADTMLLQVR